MKTVAAPIYFGLLQSTETTVPSDKRRKANLYKDFLAGGQMWQEDRCGRRTDVGRTDDCGRPNFGSKKP